MRVGKDYYDHAAEVDEGIPDYPILFLKGSNCLNGHNSSVSVPDFVMRLDYEGTSWLSSLANGRGR